MAGTAEKMLEYLLETRLAENKNEDPSGTCYKRDKIVWKSKNEIFVTVFAEDNHVSK